MGPGRRDRDYSAPAAACAADVLRVLGRSVESVSLAELERRVGRSKSLIFRVLRELERQEFVRRDGAGRYLLGIEAFELGAAYLAQSDSSDEVRLVLQRLADLSGETVNLGVLRGAEVLYLMKFDGVSSYVTISRVGGRVPANCVAIGKALLAELDDDDVRRRFHEPLPRMTPNSIVTVDGLLAELATVREAGYAVDQEQAALGRCALAVPVRLPGPTGEPAAISLSMSSEGFPARRDELLSALFAARDAIQREWQARSALEPMRFPRLAVAAE